MIHIMFCSCSFFFLFLSLPPLDSSLCGRTHSFSAYCSAILRHLSGEETNTCVSSYIRTFGSFLGSLSCYQLRVEGVAEACKSVFCHVITKCEVYLMFTERLSQWSSMDTSVDARTHIHTQTEYFNTHTSRWSIIKWDLGLLTID